MPYGIRLGADGKIETMPVAEVRICRIHSTASFLGILLIDSGATTTLLPATDAKALGIVLESGVKIMLSGVTGHRLIGYRHDIALDIQGYLLDRVPVIFAKKQNAPRVLGREGVFPRFAVVFDEVRRRTALLDAHKERSRIDALFT